MRLFYFCTLIFGISLSSCGINSSLVQDDSVYLFQGKEQIIVSFNHIPSKEFIKQTGKVIAFLYKKLPVNLQQESILIEGLSEDNFFNFYLIADRMFFSTEHYKNKALLYGYFSALYQQFYQKTSPFIPISEFNNFSQNKKINSKENTILLQSAVDYSIKDIHFISILEFLDRPERYFFPQESKGELFRVLIYPELSTFWNYLEFRFGKNSLLEYSQNIYTEVSWKNTFGESISDTEAAYVKSIDNIKESSYLLKDETTYNSFTNSLKLYMSGTKNTLMKE